MSDKKFQNGCGIILEEDGETISEALKLFELFNNFFISVASEIGLDENIVSVTDAIHKYKGHPSVEQIKKHYADEIKKFDFQCFNIGLEWYNPSVRTLSKSSRGLYRRPTAIQRTYQRLLLESLETIKCAFLNFQTHQSEV